MGGCLPRVRASRERRLALGGRLPRAHASGTCPPACVWCVCAWCVRLSRVPAYLAPATGGCQCQDVVCFRCLPARTGCPPACLECLPALGARRPPASLLACPLLCGVRCVVCVWRVRACLRGVRVCVCVCAWCVCVSVVRAWCVRLSWAAARLGVPADLGVPASCLSWVPACPPQVSACLPRAPACRPACLP